MTDNLRLIETNQDSTEEFSELSKNINDYFENTSESGPEISTVKDIINSHCDMVEEQTTANLFAPMYIGLMGTFIGIIFGVFGMVYSGDINEGDYDVNALLTGVGVAMIASFVGLLLSVINSSLSFKNAKLKFDRGKINFINYIQIEVMPHNILSEKSSIINLSTTINKFNASFNKNLNELKDYINYRIDTFKAQEALLDKFEKLNIKQISEANMKMFDSLSANSEKIAKLNESISNVNKFVEESGKLSNEANQLFGRFKNFESNSQKIWEEISNKIDQSDKLLKFLSDYFKKLEKYGSLTSNAIGKLDETIEKSIEELQIAVNKKQLAFSDSMSKTDEKVINTIKDLQKALDQLYLRFSDSIGKTDELIGSSYNKLGDHLIKTHSHIVEKVDDRANFIGTAHESALNKFDEAITSLTNEIHHKIENLRKVASEETIQLEKVIGENKKNLSKLQNLDRIKEDASNIESQSRDISIKLTSLNQSMNGGNKMDISKIEKQAEQLLLKLDQLQNSIGQLSLKRKPKSVKKDPVLKKTSRWKFWSRSSGKKSSKKTPAKNG